MSGLIGEATLISFYPFYFLTGTLLIFFIGFIYGYVVSFLFGIKKTLTVGFFVIVVSSIIILLFTGVYVSTSQCGDLSNPTVCKNSLGIITHMASMLMLVLSHLFVNLTIGHLGLILGISFYFPSEWYLKKFTKFSLPKDSVDELDKITSSKYEITIGRLPLQKPE